MVIIEYCAGDHGSTRTLIVSAALSVTICLQQNGSGILVSVALELPNQNNSIMKQYCSGNESSHNKEYLSLEA